MNNPSTDIVICEAPNKEIKIDVRLKNESVWLNLNQISTLFKIDISGVSRHIKNIYKDKELEPESTVAKIATVQKEGSREITRDIDYYNLDMVLSVGYRVNSKNATRFRIWATNILKNYLIQGYALNEKRLRETQNKFKELQKAITFMQEKSKRELLSGRESDILQLLSSYSKTFTLLEAYDKGSVVTSRGNTSTFVLKYTECIRIIKELRIELATKHEASDIFGNERNQNLTSIVENIYQTYDKHELYPTTQDKAANLLYLIIKDHPFSDGNKRIASFLFVYFLDRNGILHRETGEKRINDNALTALALLVAESDPKEKNLLISIIKSLLTD